MEDTTSQLMGTVFATSKGHECNHDCRTCDGVLALLRLPLLPPLTQFLPLEEGVSCELEPLFSLLVVPPGGRDAPDPIVTGCGASQCYLHCFPMLIAQSPPAAATARSRSPGRPVLEDHLQKKERCKHFNENRTLEQV